MPHPTDTPERASTRQFGRYRILKELGRGAMGVVHLAEDPALGRKLAIKTITLPADVRERAEYEARFMQEARAAGALNHPNIITVHDVGREGDVAYMALELLEGVELGKLMAQRRLPLPMMLDIGAQIAEGLAFAHRAGVVHRDIKPANIMVVRGAQAKIMDFGIARMRQSDIRTQTGVMLGSPRYMSPEQVAGEAVDHRSDIFTLGVLLYEMASGQPPFNGADFIQLVTHIANEAHRPLNRLIPGLPDRLTAIVDRALQKDRGARYQDAADLAADLRALKAQLDATGQVEAMAASGPGPTPAPAQTVRTQRIQTATLRMDDTPPPATRTHRGLPASERIELPHERELRLALEAQMQEPEPEPEPETGWAWLPRYLLGMVMAVAIGLVMGEVALFKRTELSSYDLSAADLARFLGLAAGLVLLGLSALKAAAVMRAIAAEQGRPVARAADLLLPFAALIIAAVGYRVTLIIATAVLSSRARTTLDWLFVLAIGGAALWLGYALVRQSDGLAGLFKNRFGKPGAGLRCKACGANNTANAKHCSGCGAAMNATTTLKRTVATGQRPRANAQSTGRRAPPPR